MVIFQCTKIGLLSQPIARFFSQLAGDFYAQYYDRGVAHRDRRTDCEAMGIQKIHFLSSQSSGKPMTQQQKIDVLMMSSCTALSRGTTLYLPTIHHDFDRTTVPFYCILLYHAMCLLYPVLSYHTMNHVRNTISMTDRVMEHDATQDQ